MTGAVRNEPGAVGPAPRETALLALSGLLDLSGRVLELHPEGAGDKGGAILRPAAATPYVDLPAFRGLPNSVAMIRSAVAEAARGRPVRYDALAVRSPGGIVVPTALRFRPVRDVAGSPVLIAAESGGLLDLRLAEDALVEARRRFEAIFHQMYQFTALLEPDGTVLEANDTVLRAMGLTREAVVGIPIFDLPAWFVSDDNRRTIEEAVREAAGGAFVRREVGFFDARRNVVILDFSLKPVFDDRGRVVLLIPEGRDITDLKRAERDAADRAAALAHAQRLNTMGELATGIAHEINQPLTAIASYAESCMARADKQGTDPVARALMVKISEQARRASAVLARLRDMVQPRKQTEEPVDILDCAAAVHQIMAADLRRADTAFEIDGHPGAVIDGDPVLIEQVLLNLVRNAVDAVGAMPSDARRIRVVVRREDDGVLCRVEDSGPGVDPAIASGLFDPFVSGKQGGMGMGLSISRSIAEAHGGALLLERAGPGAVFVLRLPLGARRL